MWEITLVGEKQDYIHFLLLKDLLYSTTNNKVLVAIADNDNMICSIAVIDKKYINFVKKTIIETIIKVNKEEYYRQNIKILGPDNELNDFILLSLVVINLQEEVDYSFVKIKFFKELHIRSLVRFRLNKLYKIWEKFINYFNYAFETDIQDRIYLEFLRFLATNSRTKEDIMFLEQSKEDMCILDKNKNLICSTPKTDEIGVIVNLIIFAPKRLIINCYDSLSCQIIELINYIFADRVSILM